MKNNDFKGLFINGERSGYAPKQCCETFTLNQLIEKLEEIKENYGGDIPIYLYNDGGYTYGHINENTISVGNYTDSGVRFIED